MTKERINVSNAINQQSTTRTDITKVSKGFMKWCQVNSAKLFEKLSPLYHDGTIDFKQLHFSAKGQYNLALQKYNASKEPVVNTTTVEPVVPGPVSVTPSDYDGSPLRISEEEKQMGLKAGQGPSRPWNNGKVNTDFVAKKGHRKSKKNKHIPAVVEQVKEQVQSNNPVDINVLVAEAIAKAMANIKPEKKEETKEVNTGKVIHLHFNF